MCAQSARRKVKVKERGRNGEKEGNVVPGFVILAPPLVTSVDNCTNKWGTIVTNRGGQYFKYKYLKYVF